jgi:hypothetical protein
MAFIPLAREKVIEDNVYSIALAGCVLDSREDGLHTIG